MNNSDIFQKSIPDFLYERSFCRNRIAETDLSVHFVGCGGIGMCGLALLSLQFGCKVYGSDVKKSKNTEHLLAKGANINIGHSVNYLPEDNALIVVYSSAVQDENPELYEARKRGIKCYKRGEYLSLIAKQYKRVVSIVGSHGKTTVTAMIVHILKQFPGSSPGYLIGGWPVGWDTLGEAGSGDIFIIEADESDLSLTLISSHIGVILNLDDDHSWNVGGKKELTNGFIQFAAQSSLLLYANDKKLNDIFKSIPCPKKIVDIDNTLNKITTENLWGRHQKENAAMAVATAVEIGISRQKALEAVKTFPGIERRMQIRFSSDDITIIEDYAHHPVEVKAAIDTIKKAYPKTTLTVIFQPHRYERLKHYFNEFTIELKKVDRIFIVPVFSAWSSLNEISSEALAENIGERAVSLTGSWKNIAKEVTTSIKKGIILILGAGDINEIIPKIIKSIEVMARKK